MKIYTFVSKYYNDSNVGVILLGDHNQIYLQKGFKITNTEESEGHIAGIKRALSFVKNMKPLYAKNDAECIFISKEKSFIDLKLNTDEYINFIKKELNIKVITKELNENDKYYLMQARQYCLIKHGSIYER